MKLRKEAITNAIKTINDTAILFYQQKNQEGFTQLENTLNILINITGEILDYQKDKTDKLVDEQILNVLLNEAMKAMEQKDTVLLADILVFEINNMLEECLNKL